MPAKKQHGGQNEYQPTEADRNTVKSMAACGFAHEIIAKCLGTFRRELDVSMPMANAAVANRLYQAAMDGHGWAVCFWLKCRAKWKETLAVEATGRDGQPLIPLAAWDELVRQAREQDASADPAL